MDRARWLSIRQKPLKPESQATRMQLSCVWSSSELCIIDYFFIAHNCRAMLYLRRPQINVPRGRRRETLPTLNVAVAVLTRSVTKRGVFERAQNCKVDFV